MSANELDSFTQELDGRMSAMKGSEGRSCLYGANLTDEEWARVAPLLPEMEVHGGRGRLPLESRAVLAGILWVLATGRPWAQLPANYPAFKTCHGRFQRWKKAGVMQRVIRELAGHDVTLGRIYGGRARVRAKMQSSSNERAVDRADV